jgi:starch synthase
MRVILASSEVVPFAKTGGLADVAGVLPRELEKLGHDVSIFLPAYQSIDRKLHEIKDANISFEIPIGDRLVAGKLLETVLPDSHVKVFLVEQPGYFNRDSFYGQSGKDFSDNCERFTFFCRAILESLIQRGEAPDLIHCNDWQTGLIPAVLKTDYNHHSCFEATRTLLTIHNLAYQGLFDYEKMAITGMAAKYFNWQQVEFFGKLNLLKTGIVFADMINTVSPTYAREIREPEQGCGLEGVLQERSGQLTGILNGIDVDDWNPETDPFLEENYSSNFNVHAGNPGKLVCKQALQKEANLKQDPEIPLIGIVGRLASQKGWPLILPVMKEFLENMNAQWVVLGTGDPNYHQQLETLQQKYPDKLGLNLGFSNEFAHRIEAGSDMFLMPSQYEPCGLNQMYSMAYGTVPIVRRTGGLADTVVNATHETCEYGTANGFCFDEFTEEALRTAVKSALQMYNDHRPIWNQLMQAGMKRDWSWRRSAKQYEELYRRTIQC